MTFTEQQTPPTPEEGAAVLSIFAADPSKPRRRLKLAIVGNYAPRKCGIATFTSDIVEQLAIHHPEIDTRVYALDDPRSPQDYAGVAGVIANDDAASFHAAARRINESGVDAVWIQHEYGIFGGESGEVVCDFVDRLAPPLILTLHTVLAEPSFKQREILAHLVARASRIMVMSKRGCELLVELYDCAEDRIEVIEHGAPDRPFGRQDLFKPKFGMAGRKVLMTFGLLGPGKGIEHAIDALPEIVARYPDVIYRIVGATHPVLLARDGEAYRDSLIERARQLGVDDHIVWDNRFLDTPELLDQLEACDIYLTPYPNLGQSTSGTLSYAVALGKAVVSTPYVHACELLGGDVGILIEPQRTAAIADAVNRLLETPQLMLQYQRRAYARGRATTWPRFADASARLVESAVKTRGAIPPMTATPGLTALFALSDRTGIMQHSIGIVPDRRHGYCLDDNVRALMLANVHPGLDRAERAIWGTTYASFLQSAWNPDAARFRNFMRYDRTWCEDLGSEDSNGRAVWALGHTVENSADADMREWALDWFDRIIGALQQLEAPRARAFVALGACAVLRCRPSHRAARQVAEECGAFLMALLGQARRPDWIWFEAVLGYDNPRLCQAMIEIGEATGDRELVRQGLVTLAWIADRQTSSTGLFRPVGCESFGRAYEILPFDQQPLEAQAAIEAARAAWLSSGDPRWREHAVRAWRWYFGANDRGAVLADVASGRCRDGVTPRGENANCGAESILAFQLSHYAVSALEQAFQEGDRREMAGLGLG